MEFNEKLQELRKQKGLTQEELAEMLFVSRTAVSKWESGRGMPNIDSLKAIAKFFSVTIDELLSCEEVLTIAEKDSEEKAQHFYDVLFGLLDLSVSMFLFLPLFGESAGGMVQAVSLLSLSKTAGYLKIAYSAVVLGMTGWGILILAMQYDSRLSNGLKSKISLVLHGAGTLLFILGRQPYAAAFLFAFLMMKVFLLWKRR